MLYKILYEYFYISIHKSMAKAWVMANGYTEAVLLLCILYSSAYRSGGYTEAVLLLSLLKWWVYRSCPSGVRSLYGGFCAWLRRPWWSGTQPPTTSSPSGRVADPDSNPDPDPPDPRVFGPPGSGSGSDVWIRILLSLSKNSSGKKNLDFYCFVSSFWLFTWKKCKSTFKK